MSESVVLSQNKAMNEVMVENLERTNADFIKDPEDCLSRVPLREEEKAEVERNVLEKMKALESIDIYSQGEDSIHDAFNDIFNRAELNRAATAELTNYFSQRNFRRTKDTDSFKAVTDLATALERYDPSKFDLTEPEGLLRFIPLPGRAKRGLSNYIRSFKEAQGQIEELMDGVASVAEDGIKAKEAIKTFDKKLLNLAKKLKIESETLIILKSRVTNYLDELKERDPLKAEKIEAELMHRLSGSILDSKTTLLHALNGSILASSMLKTQDMLITSAQRASTTGRLILTIHQTSAAMIQEQKDARELLEEVNNIIGKMSESTSRLVLEHAREMKELVSSPLGNVEKLQNAFKMSYQAMEELSNVQREVGKKMDKNIESLTQIQKEAESKLGTVKQADQLYSAQKESVAFEPMDPDQLSQNLATRQEKQINTLRRNKTPSM